MHDQLARLGCDTAQGYWLSRPLPPVELAEWLARAVKPIHEAAACRSGFERPAAGHLCARGRRAAGPCLEVKFS
jgi:hypothetical protein